MLVRDRLLRLLALVRLLAALSAGATSALLVVLAGRQLRVGPDGFGLLLAAIGVGAAFGPLLARLASNPRRSALVFGPLLLRGLVDLVLASSRSLGRATWTCPAASWTDPHVSLARGAASVALALHHEARGGGAGPGVPAPGRPADGGAGPAQ